jgi:hypothetical protein
VNTGAEEIKEKACCTRRDSLLSVIKRQAVKGDSEET